MSDDRFCILALLLAVSLNTARADTFEIGGQTIVVPVPQGFVRVTEDMTFINLLCEQQMAADPANDTLACYMPEADVPTAMAGEIPTMERYFLLKVGKQTQNLTVGKNEFAEYKKTIRQQSDEGVQARQAAGARGPEQME